jgi:hypothetical protein
MSRSYYKHGTYDRHCRDWHSVYRKKVHDILTIFCKHNEYDDDIYFPDIDLYHNPWVDDECSYWETAGKIRKEIEHEIKQIINGGYEYRESAKAIFILALEDIKKDRINYKLTSWIYRFYNYRPIINILKNLPVSIDSVLEIPDHLIEKYIHVVLRLRLRK